MIDCNWAQALEGAIDSSHSSTLHSSDMVSAQVEGFSVTDQLWLRPSNDRSPRMQARRTSFGFRYAALRKPIKNPETHEYIRTTLFIAPYSVLILPNNMYKIAPCTSRWTTRIRHSISSPGATRRRRPTPRHGASSSACRSASTSTSSSAT